MQLLIKLTRFCSFYLQQVAILLLFPVAITSTSFALAFSLSNGFAKKLLKTTRKKKMKHNKFVLIATTMLNSTEDMISKTLIDDENSYEEFTTIRNEAENIRDLKESIRMTKNLRSNTKKINW